MTHEASFIYRTVVVTLAAVIVVVMASLLYGLFDTRVNNVPLSGDIASVQAYVDGVRPVIGACTVYAPTADALAVTVHNLVPGDTLTKANVTAQLDALIASVPHPEHAVSSPAVGLTRVTSVMWRVPLRDVHATSTLTAL